MHDKIIGLLINKTAIPHSNNQLTRDLFSTGYKRKKLAYAQNDASKVFRVLKTWKVCF